MAADWDNRQVLNLKDMESITNGLRKGYKHPEEEVKISLDEVLKCLPGSTTKMNKKELRLLYNKVYSLKVDPEKFGRTDDNMSKILKMQTAYNILTDDDLRKSVEKLGKLKVTCDPSNANFGPPFDRKMSPSV